MSFNDIICILLYIFLRFVLFHIESKMSPKKQLRCREAPRDGFLGSPGTRWVFSFHPYATRFFNSFPNHCTYKPTLYRFKANKRPFFSFIFHPFLNKKKKNDVQALMSYFCRKTHMGTCWMAGILLGNRTKKVPSSQSKMLAVHVGKLTNLYNNTTWSPCQGRNGAARNGRFYLTLFSEPLVRGKQNSGIKRKYSSLSGPHLANPGTTG